MKKRLIAALLAIAIMTGFCAVIAAGTAGTASDPLISLSYLTSTFKNSLLADVDSTIDSELNSIYNNAAVVVDTMAPQQNASGYMHASQATELDLKYGDMVTGPTGTMFMLLAGSARLDYYGSAVIDVTDGKTVTSGSAMAVNHRYLVGEDTTASVTVTQDTAPLQVTADYFVSGSAATDYYALADALYSMGLFKGDGTSYGKGYALERTATRLEGLIMFIRLLGEEDEAQAYAGSNPFSDVPDWAQCYTSYAYAKGYTKGVGGGKFGTNDTLTAQHYVTFVMRALGYVENTHYTWVTALDDAVSLMVITPGEQTMVTSGTFYRSKVVYLSYFSLFAQISGTGETLISKLESAGSVSSYVSSSAISQVAVERIW